MSKKWEYDSREGVIHHDGKLIAEVAGAGGSNYRNAEGERNARLITAAPEMYDILRGIAAIISESKGIAGWHLNGKIADWDEFEEFLTIPAIVARIDGEKNGEEMM